MLQNIINYISESPDEIQLILFTGTIFLCWNIENMAGISLNYSKWKHALTNVPFALTNLPVQLLLGVIMIKTVHFTHAYHFGLRWLLPGNAHNILLLITGFLFLDLGEYVYHILMHKFHVLWIFHVVHHSDPVVDVSTTFREHPGENFIRLSFTVLWMLLLGAPLWVLLVRQVIQVFSTLFAHMNYSLPISINKYLSWLVMTPNQHHVHHHFQQPFTDSNYGDVLSIWDHLFGTYKTLGAESIVFGADNYMLPSQVKDFKMILNIPLNAFHTRHR